MITCQLIRTTRCSGLTNLCFYGTVAGTGSIIIHTTAYESLQNQEDV
jgi:hypothetical protein